MTESIVLNPEEVAAYLGVSKSFLMKARVTGNTPPYVKIGGAVRYRVNDLEEWLNQNTRRSTSQDVEVSDA